MNKPKLILAIFLAVLAILLLSGAGIIQFSFPTISLLMLNGIGATLSVFLLALIIALDLVFVVLIARTPNRWWQP